MKPDATVTITIDNNQYTVEKGITILRAARLHDVYIPTLCFHPDLSAHGGCRMCIVEVEGLRNLPTACTTPVTDGMNIRTATQQVQEARREILQLFMSEHPSSCLICNESSECSTVLNTIRKAGVTTGCRYCPKDQQCELQEIAAYLGVDYLEYPIYYRNLRVEREDPFYDRDYNLCILCGRCVRVCQEVRLANVLAIKERGRNSVVGPAFDRTHFDAGCEFCGACVEACPVGALREKTRAWEGKPEREVLSTCSFCGVGCQVRLLTSDDRVIGTLPADDAIVNKGQLCVKGRFCVTELATGHQRLRQPYRVHDGTIRAEIPWSEAALLAATKLKACAPEDFALLISPNCTNEDLYVAQKFVRTVMHSHRIDTSARLYYGPAFNAYLHLLGMSAPLSDVAEASAVLCVGLDPRFGRSVVGVEIRRALKRGAKIITINPRQHALTLNAHLWLHPDPGKESDTLAALAALTSRTRTGTKGTPAKDEVQAAADILRRSERTVIVMGSEFLQFDESAKILHSLAELARNVGAGVVPLPAQNNLVGSILMGAYPEFLPGAAALDDKKQVAAITKLWRHQLPVERNGWTIHSLGGKKAPKVLYLVGEIPPVGMPRAEYVIWQNIYPPQVDADVDLVLPAAAFTEVDGTYVNGDGRVQRIRKAVEPFGRSLPDWSIFGLIAQEMGVSGFAFETAADVHREIAALVDGFAAFDDPTRTARPLGVTSEFDVPAARTHRPDKDDQRLPYLLSVSMAEHTHRGFPLATWVEGARQLLTEGVVEMHPDDAAKVKVGKGDEVVITSPHFEFVRPVLLNVNQPVGQLHVTLRHGETIAPNPHPVKIRKKTSHV